MPATSSLGPLLGRVFPVPGGDALTILDSWTEYRVEKARRSRRSKSRKSVSYVDVFWRLIQLVGADAVMVAEMTTSS